MFQLTDIGHSARVQGSLSHGDVAVKPRRRAGMINLAVDNALRGNIEARPVWGGA